jgi:hypothetical protein
MKNSTVINRNFYLLKNRLVIRLISDKSKGTKKFYRKNDNDYLSIAYIVNGYGIRIIYDLVK